MKVNDASTPATAPMRPSPRPRVPAPVASPPSLRQVPLPAVNPPSVRIAAPARHYGPRHPDAPPVNAWRPEQPPLAVRERTISQELALRARDDVAEIMRRLDLPDVPAMFLDPQAARVSPLDSAWVAAEVDAIEARIREARGAYEPSILSDALVPARRVEKIVVEREPEPAPKPEKPELEPSPKSKAVTE